MALAVAVLLAWAGVRPAQAGPTGGTVVQGQASISAPSPLRTEIRQATDRAAIDWQAFSIGAGESVRIQQPGSGSVLFNRVTGGDPSLILGQLQANGRVFLSNPRGIVFGAGSQVDVGGLVATTLQPRDGLWRSDLLDLVQAPGGSGELRSAGRISAPGGTVVLAAPVLTHSGAIDARRVGLAAAGAVAVDVEGDGRIFFTMSDEGLANRLSMIGSLRADGGTAELRAAARAGVADTVLNLEGVVRARGLSQQGGRIVIDGGAAGTVRVVGTLDASAAAGAGGVGGSVQVEGQRVLLPAGALVDVSGDAGGGSVKLGGGMHGEDASVRNAALLSVADGAQVQADARVAGDGGSVVLWSDNATRFAGTVSARGGAAGGDGGQVEVSSKGWLDFRGTVDTAAPLGRAGSLLLDPLDLTITDSRVPDVNGDGVLGDDLSSTTLLSGDYPSLRSIISPGAIAAQSGHVTLEAARDLVVDAPVQKTGWLTLRAGNDLRVNADIAATQLELSGHLVQSSQTFVSADVLNVFSPGQAMLGGSFDARQMSLVFVGGAVFPGLVSWGVSGIGDVHGALQGGWLVKQKDGALILHDPVQLDRLDVPNGTLGLSGPGSSTTNDVVLRGLGTLDVSDGAVLTVGRVRPFGSDANIASSRGTGRVEAQFIDPFFTLFNLIAAPGAELTLAVPQIPVQALTASGGGLVRLEGGIHAVGSVDVAPATMLQLKSAAMSVGGGTGPLTLHDGSVLDLMDGASVSAATRVQGTAVLASSAGNGHLIGPVQLDGALYADVGTASLLQVSGDIVQLSGSGDITKTGGGTLALDGALQSTGVLWIQDGTWRMDRADGLGTLSTVQVDAPGVLSLFGTTHLNVLQGDGSVVGQGGDAVLSLSPAVDAEFAGAIGNVALQMAGTATQTLSGSLQARAIEVDSGTLQLRGAGPFTADATTLTGGTLDLADGAALMSTLAIVGSATLSSSGGGGRLEGDVVVDGALAIDVVASRLDLVGNIVQQGSGDITKHGAGELAQDGLLQTAGRLWLQDGTWSMLRNEAMGDVSAVQVDAPAVLSLPGSTHLRVLSGNGTVSAAAGELALGGAGDSFTFAGSITGGTALVKEGSGTLTLSGPSAYTGGTQVRAGTLTAGGILNLSRGALPISGDVDVAAGALLQLPGNAHQLGGLTGGGDVVVVNRLHLTTAGNSVFTGRFLNSHLVEMFGAGTQTFAGQLDVDQLVAGTGVLRLAGGRVGEVFHGQLFIIGTADLVDGAAIQGASLFSLGTLMSSRGNGSFQGKLIANRDMSFAAATDSRLDVAFDGMAMTRSISKNGPGTVGLSLATAGTSGPLIVNEGPFELSAPAGLNATSVTLRPGTRTTLMGDTVLTTPQVNVTGPATLATAGGSNAVMGPINVNGDFTLDVPGGTLTLGSDLTDSGGTGSLTKRGAGAVSLPSAVVRTHGPLALQQGTLKFGAANPLPDVSGVDSAAGSTLQFAADAALQALTGAGNVMLDNGAALHLGGAGASFAFAGDIDGNGSLHKDGAGTFTFIGSGTYDSGTFVHAGTLLLGSGGSLPAGGALQVDAGATVVTDNALQLGSLAGAGQVQVGGVLTVGLNDTDSRFDGTLVGPGSLLKEGAGTFTLAGAAMQTGGTQVAAGTLLTQGNERLPDSGRVQVDAGALLHLGGNETLGSLAGAGTVLADAGTTLTTGGDGSSSTLSGPLTAGTLVKQGGGTFTLANTVTLDALDLRAGTLQLAGSAAQGMTALAWLSQGTTLDLADGAQLQAQQLTAFAGTLSTSRGDGRFSGNLLLDDTLTLAVDGSTLTLAGEVLSGFPGAGLRKTGAGTLVVDSLLRHDGATDVLAGRLVARGDDHLSPDSAVTVAAGAALDLQGTQHVASLDADGPVTLGGSLIATGDLRLAGGATVSTPNAITLSGRRIDASSDANDWGTQPLSLMATGGALNLSAGREAGGAWRDLRLQDVQAAAGGQLDGGRIQLEGTLALGGGTLGLDAHAPATYGTLLPRHLPSGVPVALADDAIGQAAGSRITTAAGSLLSLRSDGFGSITLTEAGNDWQGGLQALSGPAFGTPWAPNLQTLNGQVVSGQGRVHIAGAALAVSGPGIEADLVQLDVPALRLDAGARIVERLPAEALPADAQAALDAAHALRLTALQREGEAEEEDGASATSALRQPPPCDPQRVQWLRCLAPREGEPARE